MDDKLFETLILNLIQYSLQGKKDVKVNLVEQRPQRGRDIVIQANQKIILFGSPISCGPSGSLKVNVECKWTKVAKSMSLERIASNAIQNAKNCDVFVVVTNGFFTSGALWEMVHLFDETHIRLLIVDGVRLSELLLDAGQKVNSLSLPPPIPIDEIANGVHYKIEVNRFAQGQHLRAEITVVLQNATAESKNCRVFLQSDIDWKITDMDSEIVLYLPPYGINAVRLFAKRDIGDNKSNIRIGLDIGSDTRSVSREVNGLNRLDFRAEFLGDEHINKLEQLVQAIENHSSKLLIVSVLGGAGTGKSRIVEEVADRTDNLVYQWNWFEFGSSKISLINFIERAQRQGLNFGISEDGNVADMLRSFTESLTNFKNQIPVLVLENLHNADAESCKFLIDLLDSPTHRNIPAILIMTGRSDYSHGNPHFQKLADIIETRTSANECHINLNSFESDACDTFISKIIQDAPLEVITTFKNLSGGVPGNIVQCVEWLLDMNVVRVAYRSTVGIIDHRLFNKRMKELPASMTALFADRFDLLEMEEYGIEAQEVLLSATFFGASPPIDLFNLVDSSLHDSIKKLLIGRRFLILHEDLIHLQWHHENILLHFRNWLLNSSKLSKKNRWKSRNYKNWQSWVSFGKNKAKEIGRLLYGQQTLQLQLNTLERGLLANLAGQHEEAIALWDGMLSEIRVIERFSTVDINPEYFGYLKFSVESIQKIGLEPELIPRILKGMTYIGGYNSSLAEGERAADFSIMYLRRLSPRLNTQERDIFWLRCMRAHFLLDAGQVRYSQGLLLELQTEHLASPNLSDDSSLGYEIYNCLGMLYGYFNHAELALQSFNNADKYAKALNDPHLIAKQIADRSVLYQYNDFAQWEELVLEASHLNNTIGTERHKRHADLSSLSLELIKSCFDGNVERVDKELNLLHRDCKSAGYFSIMPRLYLMKATVNFLLATDSLTSRSSNERLMDTSERAIDHGLGIGATCGIGFASWQLYNLKTMIAVRRGRIQDAIRTQMSAYHTLQKDGLLFMGNADVSCPNQIVIANLVKLLYNINSDQSIKKILSAIRTYNVEDYSNDDYFEHAIATSLKHHAILARAPIGTSLPLDNQSGMSLGLVVWV